MADGHWLVRISTGAPGTNWADVEAIWPAVQRHAWAKVKHQLLDAATTSAQGDAQ